MGRKKKIEEKPSENPREYIILDFEHLKERDKDLLISIFHRLKHLPTSVNEDLRIKEMLHYLDISGYSLCRKPIPD